MIGTLLAHRGSDANVSYTTWNVKQSGMSVRYVTWNRLSHLKFDGVSYDIGVREREDGRYSVSWVCLECFEQGPPSPAADTIERAVELAEIALHIHHSFVHDKGEHGFAHRIARSPAHKLGDNAANGAATISSARQLAQPQYERAKRRFEELRAAQSRVRNYVAAAVNGGCDDDAMYAACCDYRRVANEFSDALVALSHAIDVRSKELAPGFRSSQKRSLRRPR
jgi:hypothetical protein